MVAFCRDLTPRIFEMPTVTTTIVKTVPQPTDFTQGFEEGFKKGALGVINCEALATECFRAESTRLFQLCLSRYDVEWGRYRDPGITRKRCCGKKRVDLKLLLSPVSSDPTNHLESPSQCCNEQCDSVPDPHRVWAL